MEEKILETTKKVEFTSGEKVALGVCAIGCALIGYGVGTFIIEPVYKKAAKGAKSLMQGKNKEPEKEEETEVEDEVEDEVEE